MKRDFSIIYRLVADHCRSRKSEKRAAEVFACLLRGETIEETHVLLVAPKCLQNKVLDMIDDEICHAKNREEAYIGIKINSLTDKVIIEKLVEASQAGVKIEDGSTWNLLSDSGNSGIYRKYQDNQHRRKISGAFPYLSFRNPEREKFTSHPPIS